MWTSLLCCLFYSLYTADTHVRKKAFMQAWGGLEASSPSCLQRGSVMQEVTGVASWITDDKDRPCFVCLESVVSDRQRSSYTAASGDCTVTCSTSRTSECAGFDSVCLTLENLWINPCIPSNPLNHALKLTQIFRVPCEFWPTSLFFRCLCCFVALLSNTHYFLYPYLWQWQSCTHVTCICRHDWRLTKRLSYSGGCSNIAFQSFCSLPLLFQTENRFALGKHFIQCFHFNFKWKLWV